MEPVSIEIKIDQAPSGWKTDQWEYRFNTPDDGKGALAVIKRADRTLEVRVALEHFFHTFIGPCPTRRRRYDDRLSQLR